ncbi:hypothetical protein [Phytoactinopolyspora halotolerans]|uniref:Uncharacterized protein n=1 Tax=Phytoactinopolyspora halotolerans TaxID=1981512 RepID=A0A6L9SJ38_9ACTN|nr:hypothetical protein [Phytoactinopolyspora halotolerans]NEE04301.1 hypothetical protein [Phytoactinopolyspora halotolerans]
MRQSMTAVLERDTTFDGEFATEPYEVAWATEARWFVQILALDHAVGLRLRTQISPDGITWCDYDDAEHVAAGVGVTSWPVREFGHWLRVRGSVDPGEGTVTARIYLAVKS